MRSRTERYASRFPPIGLFSCRAFLLLVVIGSKLTAEEPSAGQPLPKGP